MTGICILTETFYPVTGGGETQTLALASGFAKMGYDVCVMTRRNDKALPKFELFKGIRIYRVAPSGAGQLKKWTLLLTALGPLIRQRHRYRLIIVSGFRILGIPALLVALLLRKRTLLKADNMGELSGEYFRDGLAKIGLKPESALVRCFLYGRNKLFKQCDRFIAISSPVQRELESQGIAASAIEYIPNSVDTERFHPVDAAAKAAIRTTLGLQEEAFVVIYTGRLVRYKGLPLLLRVWREAYLNYPNSHLLLVGTGGMDIHNCEAELKAYVKDHKLQHCVSFIGSVNNVQTYLQASDVLVLPTEREAFGISLIEAMACELAVIATRVGGIPDIVHDGVDGCLIAANESQALRDSLDQLHDQPQLRQNLARQARHCAVQRFSEQTVLQRYVQLSEDLCGQKTAGVEP